MAIAYIVSGLIIWFLQLTASAYAAYQLIDSHMIPTKYLLLVIVVLGLCQVATTLLFFLGQKKTTSRIVRRILAFIIAVAVAYGALNLGLVFDKLTATIDKITGEQSENPVKNIKRDPFVVYLSGDDTRGNDVTTEGRSDTNIIMIVNPDSHQILLLNTPRDYYIYNPALGGMDKFTHCGNNGMENSMAALENLYDIKFNYYFRINFEGFKTLIDDIDGVTVYSDREFTEDASGNNYHFVVGDNYMTGDMALAFARDRHNQADGDNGRGRHQMYVIKAVIAKLTSGTTLLYNYNSILNDLSGMMLTSMTSDEIATLINMQIDDMPSWNVQQFAVIGTGGSDYTASMPGTLLYVMYPNQDSVNRAKSLIEKVLDGDTITAEDVA